MDYILDKNRLSDIVNSFYAVTKIKVVILDRDFNAIIAVPYGDCSFCDTIKRNPVAAKRCMACDREHGALCGNSGEMNIYKCHIGLTEAISPIKIGNVHVGYIMLGQIIEDSDRINKKDEILARAEKYTGCDMEEHFGEITRRSKSEIKAATQILDACTCYLLMHDIIKENSSAIAFKITNYINDNLLSDITVDRLCREFSLSRNMLYKIFDEYFGTSVAKYIRKKRVERAKELIESGISISDAAGLSGFGDYSYFSKVVKAETGMLPSEIKNARHKKAD